MPRLVHQVPKYRKHRASGQAIVTIAGKDHYLGPHGTKASHAFYDRLVAEFLSAGRQVVEPARAESSSVVEVLAAFWRHCKNYYVKEGKPTTKVEKLLGRVAGSDERSELWSLIGGLLQPAFLAVIGYDGKIVRRDNSTVLVSQALRPVP